MQLVIKYLFTDFENAAVGLQDKEPLGENEIAFFMIPTYDHMVLDNSRVNYPITVIYVDANLHFKKTRAAANSEIYALIPKDTFLLIEGHQSLYDKLQEFNKQINLRRLPDLIVEIVDTYIITK